MIVFDQTVGLLSHLTKKSNGLALLTNKIYVLGSLASFPVATVMYLSTGMSPRHALQYYVCTRYVCMYVCMVTHIARVWINRVRLPILLVVS